MTIVMPNYNDSEFIGRAIESVLGQDFPGLEFIIVDDGSTDGSVEIIRSFGDAVTLICHEKNKGHAAAVNTGLRLVQGEIVNWLNSNDSYVPDVLPEIGRYFLRHPETNVIFGDFNVIDVDDRVLMRQRVLPLDYAYACMVGFGSLVAVSTMFMRKHVLETAGLLDETYHHVPDNDFIFRVAQNFPIRKLSMRIANWRHHPTSITRRGTTTLFGTPIPLMLTGRLGPPTTLYRFPASFHTSGPAICAQHTRLSVSCSGLYDCIIWLISPRGWRPLSSAGIP
jgi:glycosyltransferase involved in cell wall biosynthesis